MIENPVLIVGSGGALSLFLQHVLACLNVSYYTLGRNGLRKSSGQLVKNPRIKFSDIFFLTSSLRVSQVQTDVKLEDLPESKILNFCINNLKFERIIFFSSSGAVYGSFFGEERNENSILAPLSQYGFSKLYIENQIIKKSNDGELYRYIILRISNPYGSYDNFLFNYGVIPILIKSALNGFPFEIKTNKYFHKDFVHIEILKKMICEIVLNYDINGIFNVASGVPISIIKLVSLVESISGKTVIVDYNPEYLERVDCDIGTIDISRLTELINLNESYFIHEEVLKIKSIITSSRV